MYYKNAEHVINELADKGFLKYKSAKKRQEAQRLLEDLRLHYIEDD